MTDLSMELKALLESRHNSTWSSLVARSTLTAKASAAILSGWRLVWQHVKALRMSCLCFCMIAREMILPMVSIGVIGRIPPLGLLNGESPPPQM